MKWLLGPLILGVLVAGVGFGLSTLWPATDAPEEPLPWEPVWGVSDGDLLVLKPGMDATPLAPHVDAEGRACECDTFTVQWVAPGLGILNGTAPESEGPFALVDGYDAGHATFYVFDLHKRLLASNAPIHERGRFDLHGDFIELQEPVWWLGQGKAPNGTAEVPLLGGAARELLRGLPVGATATMHVPEHPYKWLLGEVVVTARIDSLMHVDEVRAGNP